MGSKGRFSAKLHDLLVEAKGNENKKGGEMRKPKHLHCKGKGLIGGF